MASFDLWQQTYCLGQMSGAIGGELGSVEFLTNRLVGKLNDFYADNTDQLGAWSTAWGPVVFEHDPGVLATADNVMYVAANADRSVFVVSIAGTNALSQYDIKQEDEAVSTTVAWAKAFPDLPPYRTPNGLEPYLSTGTVLGVNNLLGMEDGATGQTLAAYLAELETAGTPATLIFCGHSLGGALAPTLGLALFNSNGGQLHAASWENVFLYPTAGPTPGNGDLAAYVAQQFPPRGPQSRPYQVWNQNVWNSLDCVPQAWVIALLAEVPFLYPVPQPWPPQDLEQMIQNDISLSLQGASSGSGPYVRLANQRLTGTFNPDYPVTNKATFELQAAYQHTTAYDKLFDVTSIAPGAKTQAVNARAVHALVSRALPDRLKR